MSVHALIPGHHSAEALLSISDAVEESGIPRRELDRAMRTGRLPFMRWGASNWRWIKRRNVLIYAERRELAGGAK